MGVYEIDGLAPQFILFIHRAYRCSIYPLHCSHKSCLLTSKGITGRQWLDQVQICNALVMNNFRQAYFARRLKGVQPVLVLLLDEKSLGLKSRSRVPMSI